MKTHKFSQKGGPLRRKSFIMANRIVKLYKYLIEEKKEYLMSEN